MAVVVVIVVPGSGGAKGEHLEAAEKTKGTEQAGSLGGEREELGGILAAAEEGTEERALGGLKRVAWSVVNVCEAERTAVEKGALEGKRGRVF